jgi:hypothetical protein
MALSMPHAWNGYSANGYAAPVDCEINITPATGNWVIVSLHWHAINADAPTATVGDWSRNMWTLLYSATTQASVKHPNSFLHTQIWACPKIVYTGWPNVSLYGAIQQFLSTDTATVYMSIFEIAGMTNGYLTVDAVAVATANNTTSFSMTLPTPAGGADCLMVAAVTTDVANATVTASGGWTFANGIYGFTPQITTSAIWMESATAQTVSYTLGAAANWAGVAVSIRVTGVGPTQTNPSWPVVDFQLGLGYNLSTPPPMITWTSIPNRLTEFGHERGIQFELGSVQSSPTDLRLRNDDGALSPRAAGAGTATANGTTSTFVCSSTDSATMTVTDYFQLTTSGGALKEFTVFQVTGISTVGGTSTVTFTRADGNGNALVSTATGDKYAGIAIDIYLPFRIVATWMGKQYPVCVGWIERWPQVWTDPHWGDSTAIGIDVIATLTSKDYTPLQGVILRSAPHSYWTLSDASGNSVAQNSSGIGTQVLTQQMSAAGAGSGSATFGASTQGFTSFGSTSSILGDPGSGWSQTGLTAADYTNHGFALVANDTTFPSITNGVTICGVYNLLDPGGASGNLWNATVRPTVFAISNATGPGFHGRTLEVQIVNGGIGYPAINKWDKVTGTLVTDTLSSGTTFTMPPAFGTWAVTFNQTTYNLYLNGALVHSGTCNLVTNFDRIDIGGTVDSYGTGGHTWNAVHAHIAIMPRMLTVGELYDIFTSMIVGQMALPSGAAAPQNLVIDRKLAIAGWKGTRIINGVGAVNAGFELTQSTVAEQIVQIADFNAGKLFADAAGQLQFRTRSNALNQTVKAILGDRPDLGEIPYVGDSGSLQIDFDPTYLYNRVQVDNGGRVTSSPYNQNVIVATTSIAVSNQSSIAKYGLRTLGKTVSFADDADTANVMNYYLAQYANPRKRVSTVLLDPAKDQTGNTFTFVLGVEVGDLVTFKRRPIGAPAITIPCVVLDIKHGVAPDVWQTTLTLAPAPV